MSRIVALTFAACALFATGMSCHTAGALTEHEHSSSHRAELSARPQIDWNSIDVRQRVMASVDALRSCRDELNRAAASVTIVAPGYQADAIASELRAIAARQASALKRIDQDLTDRNMLELAAHIEVVGRDAQYLRGQLSSRVEDQRRVATQHLANRLRGLAARILGNVRSARAALGLDS